VDLETFSVGQRKSVTGNISLSLTGTVRIIKARVDRKMKNVAPGGTGNTTFFYFIEETFFLLPDCESQAPEDCREATAPTQVSCGLPSIT